MDPTALPRWQYVEPHPMIKPNLFIVGAPKCGTTSLASWLSEHPDLFFTTPKEPNYFSFDLTKPHQKTIKEYQELFRDAKSETIVAEASTRYLFSAIAVQSALAFSPDAKFIALLRNPVQMYFSLHNHLYQTGLEPEKSPEKAWYLQWDRERDESFRLRHPDADSLKYAKICSLGEQIERFISNVPAEQRIVLFLDDLQSNPKQVLESIFSFLQLRPIDVDCRSKNTSFRARSQAVKRVVRVLADTKQRIGLRTSFGFLNFVSARNRKPSIRAPHCPNFDRYLQDYFAQDVRKISSVLGRDKTNWMSGGDK